MCLLWKNFSAYFAQRNAQTITFPCTLRVQSKSRLDFCMFLPLLTLVKASKCSKLLTHSCFCLDADFSSQIGSILERTKMNGHRHEKWRFEVHRDSKECKTQPIVTQNHWKHFLQMFTICANVWFIFSSFCLVWSPIEQKGGQWIQIAN